MKLPSPAKLLLIVCALGWLSCAYGWHQDSLEKEIARQGWISEIKEDQVDQNRIQGQNFKIDALTAENAKLTGQLKEVAHTCLDLYSDNQKMVQWANQIEKSTDAMANSSAASQSIPDAKPQVIQIETPAPVVSIAPTIPALPPITTTPALSPTQMGQQPA